jgi:WD40 repeat protein
MRHLLLILFVGICQLTLAQPAPHLFLMGRRTTLPGNVPANVPTATLAQNGQTLVYESGIGDVYVQSLTEQAATPFRLLSSSRKITALAVAQDSRWVAVANRDSVTVARPDQGRVVWRVACLDAITLAFSPNGQTLAVGLADGRIRLYNVPDGRPQRILPGFQAEGFETPCRLLQFSLSGRELIAAGNHTALLVWSVGEGKLSHRLTGHTGSIRGIGLSPNGKRLVSVSSDNRLKIWSLHTYTCMATSAATHLFDDVAYTHQPGYVVARRNDQTLGLWRIDSLRQTATEIHTIKLPDPVGRSFTLNDGHSLGFATRHYVAEVGVMEQPSLSATRCDTCQRRIALIIGNSSYRHYTEWQLQGIPRNDAIAMERRLRELDFQVIRKLDLTAEAMQREVAAFRKRIHAGQTEMALVY